MLEHTRIAVCVGWTATLICGTCFTFAAQAEAGTLVRSAAPDWPQWRGPRRDGISDETGLLPSWPAGGPKRLWTASEIGNGYSSPIVVEGALYVTGDQGDDLKITALSTDGSFRWRSANGAAWQGSHPGARSSCTYDDGKLYHMNAHGRVACLDAATGREVWAVNVLERFEAENITWGISESLLVHGKHVFVTPAGAKGLMAALDKRTGATVWATPPIAGEQASYGSPVLFAIGQRRLLVNSGAQYAFAVDAADGRLCWQVRHLDPKNTITTTPILANDRVVFTNSSRDFGGAYGVRLDGVPGDKAWSAKLKVGHGGLICVDNHLCGASSRGDVTGWVTFDAATGTPVGVGELPPGSLIYADKRFYCLTEQGTMTLQELTEKGFRTTGSFQLAEGKDFWAHPVVCQGRLYLRYHDTLYCYDVRRQN